MLNYLKDDYTLKAMAVSSYFIFFKNYLNFLRSEFSNRANSAICYCLGTIFVRGIIHKFEIMHLK